MTPYILLSNVLLYVLCLKQERIVRGFFVIFVFLSDCLFLLFSAHKEADYHDQIRYDCPQFVFLCSSSS